MPPPKHTANNGCPPKKILGEWAQGLLPENQVDSITNHIASCLTCEAVVSAKGDLTNFSLPAQTSPFLQEAQCHDFSGLLDVTAPTSSSPTHDRYELNGEIARGGMGVVLRGRDKNLGRDLAIKVLLDKHKDNPEVVRRFVEEAQIGGQLQHPGIAPVYELGKFADKQRFFAMKLVKGETLSQLLKQRESTSSELSRLIGIFEQVCQTVAYAHSRQVIHRDLKPANIMVGAFGEVQVMDWGLAKVIPQQSDRKEKANQNSDEEYTVVETSVQKKDRDTEDELSVVGGETQTGSVIGTLEYMPPEQALGETDQLDERADVFGLGAILCRILTGKPPYVAEKNRQLYVMASQGDLQECYVRLDACGADNQLIQLTKECLEPKRDSRPRTAGVLAKQVTGYLESVDAKLRKAEVERAAESARADSEQRRRRTSMALAASMILLLGLGGGGWLYLERQESIRLSAEAESERRHAAEIDAQRSVAVAAKEKAEAEERRGRELLYATDMQLAPLLWKNPDVTLTQLRRRLDAHNPDSNPNLEGKQDLRGFEWFYYDNLVKNSAAVFSGHNAPVLDARLDGRGDLITLSERGQVRRWDLFSRKEDQSRRLELADGKKIESGALSYNGNKAAVWVGSRKTLKVWNTLTGEQLWQTESLSRGSYVGFSSNGKWLVKVDHKVTWLNAETGDIVGIFHSDLNSIEKASLSHNGMTLALVTSERNIQAYRLNENEKRVELLPIKQGGGALAIAASPDGALVSRSGGLSTSINFHDVMTGDVLATSSFAHGSNVTAFAFSPDHLVTAEAEGTIRIWPNLQEMADGGEATVAFKGHKGQVDHLALSPDGAHLISSCAEEAVRIWDLNTINAGLHWIVRDQYSFESLISPDSRMIITSDRNRVKIWDAATRQQLRHWQVCETGDITAMACSSGNPILLAVGHGNHPEAPRVTLWNIQTGQKVAEFDATEDVDEISIHPDRRAIARLAFAPDGKYLVAGFGLPYRIIRDHEPLPLKVWNVETQKVHSILHGHSGLCEDLDFAADGTKMASATQDGTAIIWSTETWQPVHRLKNPDLTGQATINSTAFRSHIVKAVSFSPDGNTLAMGTERANIHLWDVDSGEYLDRLSGHSDVVRSVDFAPNGVTLASASGDGSVRLWNVATRQELVQMDFAGPAPDIRRMQFSSDGTKLLYGGPATGFWSTTPIMGRPTEAIFSRLRDLLTSNGNFADSIRLYSSNVKLHEALAGLSSKDPRVATALAATRANWLASEERWEEAAREFDRLIELDTDAPHAWLNDIGLLRLATALFKTGRFDACNKLLATVTRHVDKYGPVKYRVSLSLQTVEQSVVVKSVKPKTPAALSGLNEGDTILSVDGIDTTPGTARRQLISQQATIKAIRVARAGSNVEEIITLAADRELLNEELRQQLVSMQTLAEQQLTKTPGNASVHEFLAGLLGILGDFKSQISEYTAAIEAIDSQATDDVSSHLARLFRRRATANLRAKQWQPAVDDYARIIDSDTVDKALLADQAAAKAGVLLTANLSYCTSLDITKVEDSWGRLAIAYYLTYNKKQLESILNRQPQAGEFIGDMLSADGLWADALAYYDRAMQSSTVSPTVFSKRAEVLEKMGKWDDAEAEWAQAGKQSSNLAFQRFKTAETLQWDTTQSNPRIKSLALNFSDGVLSFGAKPNSEPRQLCITQTKLQIENDAIYRLSFRVRSPDSCKLLVVGKRFDKKVQSIGLNKTIDVSPEFQRYQFTFVAKNAGYRNSSIRFLIPRNTPGMVMIKDIVFMKIDDTEVREIDPAGIKDSPVRRAVTFHQSGQLKLLGDIVKKHPRVNVAIGDLYANLNRWEAAISFYGKAIASDVTKASSLVKRAEAYEKFQKWNLAAADWALASQQETDIAFKRFKTPGEKPWKLWSSREAEEPFFKVSNGVVEFGKSSATKNSWGVRLTQRRLQLQDGATYALRFKIKSPDKCRVSVKAQNTSLTEDSWLFKTFRAPTYFKEHRYTFVAKGVDPEKNVISFDSGRGPGMILLKDVVLMKIKD